MLGAKARVLATILETRALSPRVRAVTLHIGDAYAWRAGQHVGVWAEAEGEGARPRPRYYSLASVPSARGTAELCVGDSDDAPPFPVGGRVWLSAPGGQPAVPEAVRALVLIGVGTGVAPLRAVVQEQEALPVPPRLVLLVGFRSERDVLYGDEFLERARARRLDYRPVLSQPAADWSGRTGHVQAHLAELPPAERYCVCGKLAMIQEVRAQLLQAGVPSQHLFAEGY